MIAGYVLLVAASVGLLWLSTSVRVVTQFQRGVVFRFGRVRSAVRQPAIPHQPRAPESRDADQAAPVGG